MFAASGVAFASGKGESRQPVAERDRRDDKNRDQNADQRRDRRDDKNRDQNADQRRDRRDDKNRDRNADQRRDRRDDKDRDRNADQRHDRRDTRDRDERRDRREHRDRRDYRYHRRGPYGPGYYDYCGYYHGPYGDERAYDCRYPSGGGWTSYRANMSADQVVPRPGPAGAKGLADVDVNVDAAELCYSLDYGGPSAISAAIRRGASGRTGPVVVDLDVATRGDQGCVPADRNVLRDLVRCPGGFHVDLRDADHPDGVMRGQLWRSS